VKKVQVPFVKCRKRIKLGDLILNILGVIQYYYVDKMREGGGQKMSVFVHAQCIKTVQAGEGVKKRQKSVHVVVE
jgi:hypothetical protein